MSSTASSVSSSTASTPRNIPIFHNESPTTTTTPPQPQPQQPHSSLPSPHIPTHHSTLPPPPAAQPPTIFQLDQSDVEYVSTRLDHYIQLYKSDIHTRLQSLVLRHQSDSQTITAQSAAIQQLQHRIEAMEDAVHNASEQSSLHESTHHQLRDRYLAHLTRQHRTSRLTHTFRQWRQWIVDAQSSQQKVTRHRTRQLQRSVFSQWRSTARQQRRETDVQHWQQQLTLARDTAVREKQEEVRRLKEEMSALLLTIRMHESDKADAEERMRQAFVRGVCALNKEAMSVFGASLEQQPQPAHPATGKEEKVQEEKYAPSSSTTSSIVSSIAYGGSSMAGSQSSSVVTFQPIPLRLSHPYPAVQTPVVSSSAVGAALRRSVSAVGGGGGGGGSGLGGFRGVRAASTKR